MATRKPRKYNKEYYEKHKEEVKEYQRAWRKAHPEKTAEYRINSALKLAEKIRKEQDQKGEGEE